MKTLVLIILLFNLVSSNGVVYKNQTLKGYFDSDDCVEPITKVLIPDRTDKCSQDIFCYYKCDEIEKMGFLNRKMV
jgi:hypothetical protein